MNCNQCVKINPLPECIDSEAYNPYYLDGLVFADSDTNMVARLTDIATNKSRDIDFVTDETGEAILEITDIFPLMNHVYVMEFTNLETGNPEHFTITNADSTTSTGCCIEFQIAQGRFDNNNNMTASTQVCAV